MTPPTSSSDCNSCLCLSQEVAELKFRVSRPANTNQEPNKPSLSLIFTVLAVSLLAIILAQTPSREMEKKLIDAEQYAVDVTLDPDTEHLIQNILSEDGKQDSLEEEKKLHMDLERVNRKLEEDMKRSQESIMDLEKDKQQSDQKIKEQQGLKDSLEELKKLHMDLVRVNRELEEDLKRFQMDLEKDKQQSDQKIKEQQARIEELEEESAKPDEEKTANTNEEPDKPSRNLILIFTALAVAVALLAIILKHSQEMEKLKKTHSQQMEKLKKTHSQEMEKLKKTDSQKIKELQESIKDLQKDKQQSDQKIKDQQDRIKEPEEASAVAQLEMEKKLHDAELKRIHQHEVDVTLDPDTAHPDLILSEDGKQVSHGDINIWKRIQMSFPGNTKRFSYCACVLGKQSFSSGRFYYEVQVKGKTEWSLGVARESINRKGDITLSPNNSYWTIVLRNRNEYMACADPSVLLPVREEVQKVGVFVDYEEGLVSFYDVEARVHLYSFTGCTFTEKLYPYFGPCLNDGGTNSAPLIISPVSVA